MTEAVFDLNHNAPPADADPLRDRLQDDHAALVKRQAELLAAADRAPVTVEDEDTAGKVADFIVQLNAAIKALDKTRVGEKEPFLQAGRTVDGFFKKLCDPLTDAKKKIEARLTAYQRKKADEERRRREEAERIAREAADKARREAEERAAKLAEESELPDAIAAEEAAKQAAADAAQAEREAEAKAAELSRSRGDHGAVASLRTFWDFENLDRETLDLNALRQHIPVAALETAVRSFIKAGGRELRGVRIFENAKTTVR